MLLNISRKTSFCFFFLVTCAAAGGGGVFKGGVIEKTMQYGKDVGTLVIVVSRSV